MEVTAAAIAPRDAATVIVAADAPEGLVVYMVRRSSRSAWLPDLYVFPGGAVDASDRSAASHALIADAPDGLDPACIVAAARETFEEAGLLFATRHCDVAELREARAALAAGERDFGATLEALQTQIDGRALRFFSRWVTPVEEPRRFDARFFVARAPAGQIAEADALETHDGRWMRPSAALAAYEAGEIGLIFPTIKHLVRIAPYDDVDALVHFAENKRIVTVSPEVSAGDPVTISLPPELEDAW